LDGAISAGVQLRRRNENVVPFERRAVPMPDFDLNRVR
jgi:hypothetical protein